MYIAREILVLFGFFDFLTRSRKWTAVVGWDNTAESSKEEVIFVERWTVWQDAFVLLKLRIDISTFLKSGMWL